MHKIFSFLSFLALLVGGMFSHSAVLSTTAVQNQTLGLSYSIQGNTIYYKDIFEGMIPVLGADPKTFTLIKEYGTCVMG